MDEHGSFKSLNWAGSYKTRQWKEGELVFEVQPLEVGEEKGVYPATT